MTKVRVAGSRSRSTASEQGRASLENPLGKRGLELHQWMFGTRMFQAMIGKDGGSDGVDRRRTHIVDGRLARLSSPAYVRTKPPSVAGRKLDGRWGADSPLHAPTFVLSHHPRDPNQMGGRRHHLDLRDQRYRGGVAQAKQAANGQDVKNGGGVETVRQYLRAGLVDELHIALSPVVLGQGEAMFTGSTCALGYRVTERQATGMPPRRSPPIGASVEWAKARSHSPSKQGVNALLARAFITVPADEELVGTIHDRMPAIIPIAQHARWLGAEPDPRDLLQPFSRRTHQN